MGETPQSGSSVEISMSPLPHRSNPIIVGKKTTTPTYRNKPNNAIGNTSHLPVTPPLSSLSSSDLTSGRITPAAIDDFLASISSMSTHTQKQKLGDIMWNYVKPLAKPLAKVRGWCWKKKKNIRPKADHRYVDPSCPRRLFQSPGEFTG